MRGGSRYPGRDPLSARPIRLTLHGEELYLAMPARHRDIAAEVEWIFRHAEPADLVGAFGSVGG